MSSPTKEELPRIADTIKSELLAEHKLKPTETQEKVVLPSQTGKFVGYSDQTRQETLDTIHPQDKLAIDKTDQLSHPPTTSLQVHRSSLQISCQ